MHKAQDLEVDPVHTDRLVQTPLSFINSLARAINIEKGPQQNQTIKSPFSHCEEQLCGGSRTGGSLVPTPSTCLTTLQVDTYFPLPS